MNTSYRAHLEVWIRRMLIVSIILAQAEWFSGVWTQLAFSICMVTSGVTVGLMAAKIMACPQEDSEQKALDENKT